MGTSHMFLRSPNQRHRQPWLVMLSWLRPNSSSQYHQRYNPSLSFKGRIPSIKEPPDGLTMIPWHAGRHLVWDATVVDTLATSYVQAKAAMAGAAAEIATERKNAKYSALLNTHVTRLRSSSYGDLRSNQRHWPELSVRRRSQADHVNRRQPRDLFLATIPLYHHTTF